jgi:tetratricopeptide (TPR) repeat protein
VWIEDWEGAVKLQKELLSIDGMNIYYHLECMVEYSKKAGMREIEATSLWRLGRFLEAAKIVYDIKKDKKIFFDAAQVYLKRGGPLEAEFFRDVWRHASTEISYKMPKGKEGLEQFNKTVKLIHAAYELPIPAINKGVLSLNETENKRRANEFYKEFVQKKKKTKKRDLPKLLFTLYRALEHALGGGAESYRIKEALKEGFVGMPRKRPYILSLPPELKEIWQHNLENDTVDNVLMAAKTFEEGGYYKEAKESYLKASLPEDATRMDKLIEDSKTQDPPKV